MPVKRVRTGKCLYLVSSSSSREYVADCVESLALPAGMVQHFRYRLKYIDDRLSDFLPNRPNKLGRDLQALPVIVVYVYQAQTGGHWKPEERVDPAGAFMPLRCGSLIDAFRDGQIAHFYFQVSDYVKPSYGRIPTRELLNRSVRFRTASTKDARPSYAHLGRDLGLADKREGGAIAFQKFVDTVYRPSEWRTRSSGSAPLDVTYEIVFVRVAGIFRERRDDLIALTPSLRGPHGNPSAEYELQSGETYHIKIVTHLSARVPAELPAQGNARLRLLYDPSLLRPVGPTSFRLSSAYDLQYWSIIADCTAGQRTVLNIICEHDGDNDHDGFVRKELLCPELSLPISIVSR